MNMNDSPEMRIRRKNFGKDLDEAKKNEYFDLGLSKKLVEKWMIHMEAVHGIVFDEENKAKFLDGKWSMYRLDTLEHRLMTIDRNTNDRVLNTRNSL